MLKLRIDPGSTGTIAMSVLSIDHGPTVRGRRRASRHRITLRAGPGGFDGGVSIVQPLPDSGTTPPWFLLPGFFYGQGRTDPTLRYPALGGGGDGWTSPTWDFALDRIAYPLAMARTGSRWVGLDWSPHFDADGVPAGPAVWGESEPQVGAGLSWTAGGGEVRINIPANERPRRHARNPRDAATAKRLRLPAGASVRLDVGTWDFTCEADAAHGYQEVLELLYAELRPTHPPAPKQDDATLADAAAHGLIEWHWIAPAPATADSPARPGYMVYTACMDRSVEFNANVNRKTTLAWHFESLGFVGGFPVAFGLLWHGIRRGDARAIDVATQMADRFCREGISPAGLFRTSYHPGRARTINGEFDNGSPVPAYGACWQPDPNVAHGRTTADASFYLARMLAMLAREKSAAVAPEVQAKWLAALRTTLTAAVRLQRADGRHAQMYDVIANSVRSFEGCGGMLWIAAMHAAHDLFAGDTAFQDSLRDSMQRAGHAYAADVEAEYLYGAPEDVSLAPTSEDGYNAIMAYAALDERFGGSGWRKLWQRAADWTLTWRKAYNVRFSPKSMFAQGDLRTVGGDFASSNNNHLHVYGDCCVGLLHRLANVTGNAYYADRADDVERFTAQQLSVETGQWNSQRGMLAEQFYTNDWSIWDKWDPGPAHAQKGTVMGTSHVWCVNMVLLAIEDRESALR